MRTKILSQKQPPIVGLAFVLNLIGKKVKVTVDRPLGSTHPKFDYKYPVNYGYVENFISGDGDFLDAYILFEKKPLKEYSGVVGAVIHRLDDNDDKLIVLPRGKKVDVDVIKKSLWFQEKYFCSVIFANKKIAIFNHSVKKI
ncbi:MAG: inorganic pyrophosphatase [Candidatus Magasanikbacteria bacterium]